MGIIATQFWEGAVQANGEWRYVTAEFTFHTNEIVTISNRRLPIGQDASAWVAAQESAVEAQMLESEDATLLSSFDVFDPDTFDGSDPLTVVPQHPDTDDEFTRIRRFRRRLFRLIIRRRSIVLVRAILIPIYEWIQAQGYNASQIRTYLNLTQAQFNAIKTRLDAIQANLAFIDADVSEEIND